MIPAARESSGNVLLNGHDCGKPKKPKKQSANSFVITNRRFWMLSDKGSLLFLFQRLPESDRESSVEGETFSWKGFESKLPTGISCLEFQD